MSVTHATKRATPAQSTRSNDGPSYGFPVYLLRLVLCPKDGGRLALLATSVPRSVREGWVQCGTCRATYEISGGILRLLPAQEEVGALVKAEQAARDKGAHRYDARFRPWENAIELAALRRAVNLSHGGIMLDVACGTGRLTIPLAQLASAVVAADLSEDSLHVFAGKLQPEAKIGLVWTDAAQLRIATGAIDLALATQFIEHIPDRARRLRFFDGIHCALRDGGELLLSAYYYSALRALFRRKREGLHANGIFYHRFSVAEIRGDLNGLFHVLWTRPTQVDPRLLPVSNRAATWIAAGLEKLRLPFWVGQLLLVKARKRNLLASRPSREASLRPAAGVRAP